MTKYGTSFAESEALLAAQSGDEEHARKLVADLLAFERRDLADACRVLLRAIGGYCGRCGERITAEDEKAGWYRVLGERWHRACWEVDDSVVQTARTEASNA